MILNSFAILAGFLALLRLAGGLVLLLALVARRHERKSLPVHKLADDRFYLLLLLAVVVLALNVLSWPLLYFVLQSYVPEFPGVMCIYGVTRVGAGSTGPARHLPGLVAFLQVAKPTLVFASGAWFTLYALNRRCDSSPLLTRLVVLLVPIGVLVAADAVAELAYLGIPKVEDVPTAGCCVAPEYSEDRFVPKALTADGDRGRLTFAFFGGSVALALAVLAASRLHHGPTPRTLAVLFAGATGLTVIGGVFAVDVAAPALLGLPDHHCVYDLLPRVPEAVLAATLFVAGGFSLGWAWLASLLGRHPEAALYLPAVVNGLLRFSLWCYLVSVPMVAVELALA
jgi:hypothetical protein